MGDDWPQLRQQSEELGILEGITAGSEGATRGDVALMLYRAMDLPIDGDEDDTMLLRHDAALFL